MINRLLVVVASLLVAKQVQSDPRNTDTFNYDETVISDNQLSYGPQDWIRVRCRDLDQCLGWPDGWETGVGWELEENSCRWCPAEGSSRCGAHHQSPIDLQRNRAIEDHAMYNECIDVHWMQYHDSSCTWSELTRQNAFTIERHALKVSQPIEALGGDKYRIGCRSNIGRQWGKIDFSKGFSQWWHLSHMDFHVPSEHTQEGKRYSGEIQMYHFYSVSGDEAGVNNELGTVGFFLESYDSAEDYDFLNKIICQWRKNEDETREACGLPSVNTEYPGCYFNTRGKGDNPISTASLNGNQRNLRDPGLPVSRPKVMSAHDIMVYNYHSSLENATHKPKIIVMHENDYKAEDDFDWDAFIEEQYRRDEEKESQTRRHLLDYENVGPWHNYFPLMGVRTEYYYRYSGTQTIPPCYGNFVSGGNRAKTNNWRMMKDPLRVSHRQIREMHRLLRERIAPNDAPINACRPDTAAKVDPNDPDKVWVARPLQDNADAHHEVFCECDDWASKWKEDKQWCRMTNKKERFYDHPYNFATDGF